MYWLRIDDDDVTHIIQAVNHPSNVQSIARSSIWLIIAPVERLNTELAVINCRPNSASSPSKLVLELRTNKL